MTTFEDIEKCEHDWENASDFGDFVSCKKCNVVAATQSGYNKMNY